MPLVGGTYVKAIHGLPECCHPQCSRRVHRIGGVIMSAYCLGHYREELWTRMEAGLRFDQARQQLWEERPRVRLVFEEE